MPVELSARQVLHGVPTFIGHEEEGRPGILEAAADRSIIREEASDLMLPPAGADRAETVFAIVGTALMLVLAFAFLWTLLRQRR